MLPVVAIACAILIVLLLIDTLHKERLGRAMSKYINCEEKNTKGCRECMGFGCYGSIIMANGRKPGWTSVPHAEAENSGMEYVHTAAPS